MTTILIVEDDPGFANDCVAALMRRGLDVKYAQGVDQARTQLLQGGVEIALIDLMLPPTYDHEGLDLLRYIKRAFPTVAAFLMTTRDSRVTELVASAMQEGARYFLDKNASGFDDRLERVLQEYYMERQSKVFLSHGHNELLKLKLKDFITTHLGRGVVVLSEQPSRGLTIVEKLERASNECFFAVILMTKDDEQADRSVRARQNVVHEIGFFQGKYGRKYVVLLAERGVETFSNISGIVRIEFDADHFEAIFESLRLEIEDAFASAGIP